MNLKKIILILMSVLLLLACKNLESEKKDVTQKIEKKDLSIKKIYFNSRDTKYKEPYGAIINGTEVKFNLECNKDEAKKVFLIIEKEKIIGEQEISEYSLIKKIEMKKSNLTYEKGKELWEGKYKFNEIGVFGYYFKIKNEENKIIYHNNNKDPKVDYAVIKGTGGIGEAIDKNSKKFKKIRRYKQTVYSENFKTPDWIKGEVFYALYPDRFKNGNKTNDPILGVRKFYGNTDIEVHNTWMSTPNIPGRVDKNDSDDEIWNNDFYGGDIDGIIEKLDYIKELGATVLYLNPIFQAPSYHRYDTTDYHKVDEALGDLETFKKLITELDKRDMKIILDTSFNHCGDDSIYFDRYGKYDEIGAFENEKIIEDNKYYDWFTFKKDEEEAKFKYQWWNVESFPELNDGSESFRDFSFRDKNSVSKYWLGLGIDGWRMDIASWVSDDYWREWRKEIKKDYPESYLMAEVWFDSSKYFTGDTFDSTMNYIFREAIVSYIKGKRTAEDCVDTLEMMRENYPKNVLYGLMNMLGSHYTKRVLYEFGYISDKTDVEKVEIAKRKLLLAQHFQMVYPGAPTVYYGDEVGLTGGDDPLNRGPYPWVEDGGNPDINLLENVKKIIKMRNENQVLKKGEIENIAIDKNIIMIMRTDENTKTISILNSGEEAKKIAINLENIKLINLISDKEIDSENGKIIVEISGIEGKTFIIKNCNADLKTIEKLIEII